MNRTAELPRNNKAMSFAALQNCLRNRALQSLHTDAAWVVSTYLSPFHSSSHFLESRAKFSNEVMLPIGIPVPNYALRREKGKEHESTFFFRQKIGFIDKHYRKNYDMHWMECFIRRKSPVILKTYSCPDQNETTSGISTQLATDSFVLSNRLMKARSCILERKDPSFS